MTKKNKIIAITGLSGVIGSELIKNLGEFPVVFDLYNSKKTNGAKYHTKLNLLEKHKIYKILKKINPDIIIHMASVTHIDVCEKDKKRGKEGKVWKLNVESTKEIASYSKENKKHIIFLSSECVFDGKKKYFTETSRKNPLNWYGVTKNNAEEAIIKTGGKYTILRSVVTYHKNDNGKTIYGKILKSLKSKKPMHAVDDQKFTPTFTQDIVNALKAILKKELTGIYHVAPNKSISPYEFAVIVAKKNNFSVSQIKKKKLVSFYNKKRAGLRLRNASLSAKASIKKLGFIPKNPEEIL